MISVGNVFRAISTILLLSVVIGYVIAGVLNDSLIKGVGMSLPFISTVIGYLNYRKGSTSEQGEENATSTAHERGENLTETTETSTETGKQELESTNQSVERENHLREDATETFPSVTKFDQTILEEKQEAVQDLFQIDQDGVIELSGSRDLDVYREMLVYTIAIKYAAAEGLRNSKKVRGAELKNELLRTKSEVWLFMNKTSSFLTSSPYADKENFSDILDRELEIDLKSVDEAIQWIREPNDGMRYEMDLYFGSAEKCIQNGIEECEDNESQSVNPSTKDVRGSILYETTESLKRVQDYPIRYKRDGNWTGFVRSVDAISVYVEDREYSKIKHCFEKMDEYSQMMYGKYEKDEGHHR